jgi:hypothetical protein
MGGGGIYTLNARVHARVLPPQTFDIIGALLTNPKQLPWWCLFTSPAIAVRIRSKSNEVTGRECVPLRVWQYVIKMVSSVSLNSICIEVPPGSNDYLLPGGIT